MNFMRAATKKKRDHVINVALSMFIEQGFENVSVDDIIKATNTSKGTFYHYFNSKEDIAAEVNRKQMDLIQAWVGQPTSKVESLEGHINRLFIDLASITAKYHKLIRSLLILSMQNKTLFTADNDLFQYLFKSLQVWLPDPRKAELLVTAYLGSVVAWSVHDQDDLPDRVRNNLALVWAGIRNQSISETLHVSQSTKEVIKMKVAIIGGGLAGLTTAAYLSEESSIEGILFERSPQLGGRAFTYEKSGFTLNYGAHAIYALDRHKITTLEKELGLSFSSKQVDKRQVMYSKNGFLTPAPLDFVNLMRTDLLNVMQKVRFVGEITAIIAQIHSLKNFQTLGDYLAQSNADDDVKELWEHLVCSNFFITPEDARKVSGTTISDYYQNLFLSNRPVNYVLGSWAVITNQLKQKIEQSGNWRIALQEGVESLNYADKQFILKTKGQSYSFDKVIFAMPVQQVVKLLKNTAWEPFLAPYEDNTSTDVMVYDVGLSEVVARPFNYISDMDNKMFISDVSATDHTLVPEGGQLLQGIAYLSNQFINEDVRKSYLDQKTAQMEMMFDQHYPGWREAIVVKRVSKKAMVSSVKNIVENHLLPNRVENIPFYFCGDGCVGKGELAERAFSSARAVAQMIIQEVR
ncbi:TetR family transcriptional regulator [Paenibacillus psychroresistens]|uniref:TetR family transcriptional regulator n=1 Tax=Paenibacillus psychroresistens TaxID=1778678 RepID=A0A6B8RI17_9BACL|nr:FAD-dependent oxidoreductase [Paenibacillus psychroresistens]QGQ95719.1 TetR family transcriptional regulator [Paenibacillus psychroresistens]